MMYKCLDSSMGSMGDLNDVSATHWLERARSARLESRSRGCWVVDFRDNSRSIYCAHVTEVTYSTAVPRMHQPIDDSSVRSLSEKAFWPQLVFRRLLYSSQAAWSRYSACGAGRPASSRVLPELTAGRSRVLAVMC